MAPPEHLQTKNNSSPTKRKNNRGPARRSKRIKLDNGNEGGVPNSELSTTRETSHPEDLEEADPPTLAPEVIQPMDTPVGEDMQVDSHQLEEPIMDSKEATETLKNRDEDFLTRPEDLLIEPPDTDHINDAEGIQKHEPTTHELSAELPLESMREYSEPPPSPTSSPAPSDLLEPEELQEPPVPTEEPFVQDEEPPPAGENQETTEDVNDWLMTDVEQSIEEEPVVQVTLKAWEDETREVQPPSPIKEGNDKGRAPDPVATPEPADLRLETSRESAEPVETSAKQRETSVEPVETHEEPTVVETLPEEVPDVKQPSSPEESTNLAEGEESTTLAAEMNEEEPSDDDAMDLDLSLDLDITLSPEDQPQPVTHLDPVSALIDEARMSMSGSTIESPSPPLRTILPRLKTSNTSVLDTNQSVRHSSLSREISKPESELGEFQETADEFARSTMAMPAESSKQTSMSPYPKFEVPANRSTRPSVEPQRRPIPPSVEMSSTNLSRVSSPMSAAVTLPTPPAQSPTPAPRPSSPAFGIRSTPRPIGRPPSRPSRGGLRHVNHDSDVRSKLLMARPKTAIPTHMDPSDYARECLEAAMSSRLPPYSLDPDEHRLLRTHINHVQVTTYLNIRNGILRLWMLNPTIAVCREEALGVAKEDRHLEMAAKCHEFLVRHGHINFGCIIPPRPLSRAVELPKENSGTSRRRKRVVVIGAGAAGLGCARQLVSLFEQFADRFPRNSDLPEVVVLEGRNRIGGRIYSHPISPATSIGRPASSVAWNSRNSTYSTSSNSSLAGNNNERLPDPAVDLGAQIVTGFDNGNPLAAIVKRQLRLRWHDLHDDSLLFNDMDGKRVDRTQDARAERLFNDILDRASSLKERTREQTLIEGDRELIDQGKEPHGESGRQIAKVEENEAILPPMPPSPPLSSRETLLSNHAFSRSTAQRHHIPARRALAKLGFKVKDDDYDSKDNKREIPNIHKTLGDTMRSILLDIQALVDLSPMDLKLLNWHWANLEYGNATNLNKLSLKYWDQDDGNESDPSSPFSLVGFLEHMQ